VAGKSVLVDFGRCQPEKCVACAAAAACSRGLLVQECAMAYPMPDPYICRGCGDCVRACPFKAVMASFE